MIILLYPVYTCMNIKFPFLIYVWLNFCVLASAYQNIFTVSNEIHFCFCRLWTSFAGGNRFGFSEIGSLSKLPFNLHLDISAKSRYFEIASGYSLHLRKRAAETMRAPDVLRNAYVCTKLVFEIDVFVPPNKLRANIVTEICTNYRRYIQRQKSISKYSIQIVYNVYFWYLSGFILTFTLGRVFGSEMTVPIKNYSRSSTRKPSYSEIGVRRLT